jgi:hypothetical protein
VREAALVEVREAAVVEVRDRVRECSSHLCL